MHDSYPLIETAQIKEGNDEVLDLCCGSGVITINMAWKGAKKVIGLDINP
jgi:ribosomal protein L11 methylase PrmA